MLKKISFLHDKCTNCSPLINASYDTILVSYKPASQFPASDVREHKVDSVREVPPGGYGRGAELHRV